VIVDKATIYLKAGSGGEGNSSLIKLSSRKAIGAGGDGGKGGDVVLKVSPHLYDLSKFKGNKKFIAQDGERGRDKNKKGKDADNLLIGVPLGTRVFDEDQRLIADLNNENSESLICQGGRGGRGNYKKDYILDAEDGEEKTVVFDYRIPNDVAIIGFPNSGRTSLFNALCNKDCKVAEYPFTTLSCFWAEFEHEFKVFTVLDTPPIKKTKEKDISNNSFLRHIFRSKIIILLTDDFSDYGPVFSSLSEEISRYDPLLTKKKKFFYLLNKIDKIDRTSISEDIFAISAKECVGIEELKSKIINTLKEEKKNEDQEK